MEAKRIELALVNTQLNRMGKMTARKVAKLNDASRKMILANLNDLMVRKVTLLTEITAA